MGFFSSILVGALASWATIASASGAFTPKKEEISPLPEIPKSATDSAEETIKKAEAQAQATTRQRQAATRRSKSIFSSPLGLAGEAATAKKTLLGQ